MNGRTYNDDLLNEKSRAVFSKCMDQIDAMLSGNATMNTERLHALGACADAAACGFKDEDDSDKYE